MLSRINKNSTLTTSIISIFLGMAVGSIVIILGGYDTIDAYKALFGVAFQNSHELGETIRSISPLILTGLSVAIAFRSGLFNIGVEGQFIIGQLVAVMVGTKLDLPPYLHVTVALIFGALGGAIWALIPGLLKALRGVHEVIISIMTNYIALYISNFLVRTWLTEGADSTKEISETASLRVSFLSSMFDDARIHLGIVIAIISIIIMYYLLWKTKLGFELRAVGFNPGASRYAGINVKRSIIISMVTSGVFAGLAGATELLGTFKYLSIQPSLIGTGFDGIAVALLGANTPLGILGSATLFGTLFYGASNMQFQADVPFEVIRIVSAAIILFVAANVSQKLLKFKRKRNSHKVINK